MHVLQLSWEFPPHVVGGLGRHVSDLTPALADAGVCLSVTTPLLRGDAAADYPWPGIRVNRVPTPPMTAYDFPSFVAETNRRMERATLTAFGSAGRPDLIHAHDWLVAEAAISLKHHWRIPLVATIHATERGRHNGYVHTPETRRVNDIEWRLTYEAWRVIVCSQYMIGQIETYFQTPADKIDLIPNGVSIHQYPFQHEAERAAFRRRFVAPDQALVFSVGRLVREKGLHLLIDAWPAINAAVPARLVIAGSGDQLDALKAQAAGLGMERLISFVGFITDDDRDRLYHAADLAVFPSLYEPFGIVALEACAAGCPVLVAATGGLAEVIDPDVTGIVVPADDVGALREGVQLALRDSPAAATRAEHALAMVRSRYTWPGIAADTLHVYRRVHGEWLALPWGKELIVR
ncbi:MAG: glycosyltransferase family 4 protein [Oscillochloris sp.]|nr:glycosyltransferase family 4 protein [Oscillochloris sp.]